MQNPVIRNKQTAYPYQNAQEPNIRNRQMHTYRAECTKSVHKNAQTYPYQANAQNPFIRNRQNAYPYQKCTGT